MFSVLRTLGEGRLRFRLAILTRSSVQRFDPMYDPGTVRFVILCHYNSAPFTTATSPVQSESRSLQGGISAERSLHLQKLQKALKGGILKEDIRKSDVAVNFHPRSVGFPSCSPFATRKSGHVWRIWPDMHQKFMPKSTKVVHFTPQGAIPP